MHPLLVGAGKPAYPRNACVQLALLDERRFANGIAYLRHRTRS